MKLVCYIAVANRFKHLDIIPQYGKMHVAKNSPDVTVATVLLQKGSNVAATSALLCYKQSFFGHFVQNDSKYFGH